MSDTFIIVWFIVVAGIAFWLGTSVKCTVDTFAGGQICVKDTCLDEDDIKRIKALPMEVKTRTVNFGKWQLRPEEEGDKTFIIRDTRSQTDSRYAFPGGVFMNMATAPTSTAPSTDPFNRLPPIPPSSTPTVTPPSTPINIG